MKTNREWFETLKPEIAEKAIKNTIEIGFNGKEELEEKSNSLKIALSCSFVWKYSPEGEAFWSDIAFGRNTDCLKNEE